MTQSREVLGKCNQMVSAFVGMCRQIPEDTDENEASMMILEGWREVKLHMAEAGKRWKRTLEKRLRSRKLTLRKQAQRECTIEEISDALMMEVEQMEQDDRKDYCYRSFVKDYIVGENPTRQFYDRIKARNKSGTHISGLLDPASNEVKKGRDMLGVVSDFYTDLYQSRPSDQDSRRELLQNLDRRISNGNRRNLTTVITAKEICSGLSKEKLGRSPEECGLPHDIYKKLSMLTSRKPDEKAWVVKTLGFVFWALQHIDEVSKWFKRGVLCLLYKKGEPTELKNYRPLSIMGFDYRLYTWILTKRLTQPLSEVIGDHQSAFLPGRLIGDNIKLVQSVIDKHKDSTDEIGLLFLDNEKAYDKVSHAFLWAAMRKIGIPKEFIKWVKALYYKGTLVPYVNGFRGQEIDILCGVRQGDALSCLLFIVTMEALATTVNNCTALRGVNIPRGLPQKIELYADDTVLFFNTLGELRVILRLLRCFRFATGQTINWIKSFLLLLGGLKIDLPADFPAVQILAPGEAYKHLGIPVRVNIDDHLNQFWETLITKLESDVDKLVKMRMSQRSRVRCSATFIMSQPRFAISHLWLSKKNEDRIKKLQGDMIWNNNAKTVSSEHGKLPVDKGGFDTHDVESIKNASTVNWIARMESRPGLAWCRLAATLMLDTKSRGIHSEKAKTPWKQVLNSTRHNVERNPSMKHI